MHRGDHAVFDAEIFVDHLNHGGDAVCGAGCRGEQVVLVRLIEMIIAAHDNVECAFFDRVQPR